MERRLAAILAADAVGYSRLMGLDEAATIAELQRHRDDIFEPKAAQHNGRTVKLMGDGALMEFASVVDAVTFAVDVQTAVRDHNADVPEDRRIVYRIGINLGDIVHKDDDIYGDGVNVAARLEALAEPGGICVSRSARDQVRDRLDLNFEDRGEIAVKNISRPVRVFTVLMDDSAEALTTPVVTATGEKAKGSRHAIAAAVVMSVVIAAFVGWWQPWAPDVEPADEARMALALPDAPSIAVLPFDNISDDKTQDYFADGMTDDLITDLSKLSDLFVISRNSTFTYKGKRVKVRQVAEDLGVRYVLEGSVRRAGDRIRINAQLIDSLSGYHLWAERYDGPVADVFKLQDEVIGQIVAALAIELKTSPTKVAGRYDTAVPAAYDAFLRAREHYLRQTPEDFAKAISLFEKAIELDPAYSRAYANLAAIYWVAYDTKWDVHLGVEYAALQLAEKNLAKALERPTSRAHQVSAEILAARGRNADAMVEIDKAMRLEPNYADGLVTKAWILTLSGRAAEAEKVVRRAMRLNPDYGASYLRALGRALFFQKRHAEAAEAFERAVTLTPEYEFAYQRLAGVYGHLGRQEDARAAVEQFNSLTAKTIGGQLTLARVRYVFGGDWYDLDKDYLAHWLEGLAKAGVPEGVAEAAQGTDHKEFVTRSAGVFDVSGAVKIDAGGAKVLFDRGVVFIDSRGENSYRRGHVPGAIHIYLSDMTKSMLANLVGLGKPLVFYCGGEDCYLSANASAKAVAWGFPEVYYFAGGFPAWKRAGYEVETADGKSPSQ